MLLSFLHRVAAREDLSASEAREAMLAILEGESTTTQIAAFLVALRMKGETAEELLGFARAMREKSTRVQVAVDSQPLLDTCGTGGDGAKTFNISTIAAFVVAGAGVRVAKHGNRSLAGACGSADLLEEFGVRLLATPESIACAISTVGIGFMFAPAFHPAMKHAQPARQELRMRTVFNLLGPLANPAGVSRQLIGAPSLRAAELMAGALASLGAERAFVVYGSDGLDEVTTTGSSEVFEVRAGEVRRFSWHPSDFGVETARMQEIAGGDRAFNRAVAESILRGEKGAQRDIVLVNAAAALLAAGVAVDVKEAIARAGESLDSGAAAQKLEALAKFNGQ
ncbi:MAG TPA: anthranilate phosphoribosyltransferase [Bryobacteraceae bacterium]|nr:anthranilate phosphoribosyltransferase [Bryobacteraceae bacterium]